MSKIINVGLRGLQFLWTLLILALVGNSIAIIKGDNPSIINYVMFVAVFSLLSLFYLIPSSFAEGLTGHAAIPLTLDALNTIFFFCGAVALAAKLGVHSCSNDLYTRTNSVIAYAPNPSARAKVCHESQANDAFLWFGFAAYVGSLVFSGLSLGSGGANLRGGVGGIRRGPPAMSQV